MQATSDHKFSTIDAGREYATAGNATLTLQSEKTGVHFTYKVKAAKDNTELFFVSLLSGSDNTSDYQYLGIIREGKFTTTRASRASNDAPSVKAFSYFWNSSTPVQLTVRHAGKCGRCGRTLTEPESLDSGLGPECRAIMEGANV